MTATWEQLYWRRQRRARRERFEHQVRENLKAWAPERPLNALTVDALWRRWRGLSSDLTKDTTSTPEAT